jgi:hypothetical protein
MKAYVYLLNVPIAYLKIVIQISFTIVQTQFLTFVMAQTKLRDVPFFIFKVVQETLNAKDRLVSHDFSCNPIT